MKRFWIICPIAVIAAMIFGSLLHRGGQAGSAGGAIEAVALKDSRQSYVAETNSQIPDSEMPFDSPLIPELLPGVNSVSSGSNLKLVPSLETEKIFPKVSFSSLAKADSTPPAKIVSSFKILKMEDPVEEVPGVVIQPAAPQPAAPKSISEEVEEVPAKGELSNEPFLPIVLHIGSEDGKLILQGSIPTRKHTDAVYEAAVKAVGEDFVVNHLKFSPDTIDEDWVTELPAYIGKFFEHSAGNQELIVVDNTLKLRGDVPSKNSKNGLLAMAESFTEAGLKMDHVLEIEESLAGTIPELSGTYPSLVVAGAAPNEEEEPQEIIELAMLETVASISIAEDARSLSASIAPEEAEIKADSPEPRVSEVESEPETVTTKEPVPEEPAPEFFGPANSPDEWAAALKKEKDDRVAEEAAKLAIAEAAAKAKAEEVAAAKAATEKKKAEMAAAALATAEKKKADDAAAALAAEKKKAEMKAASLAAAEKEEAEKEAAAKAAAEKAMAMIEAGETIPDDGKPLIFYFETNSSEIISVDREKIARAIQRLKRPRSIAYITAYADYRGGYEANRKLSLQRAEKVRSAIFSGDIADQVTAEITAKGDSQSVKQDVGKRETDEALKRSRRVVVEVYHLK